MWHFNALAYCDIMKKKIASHVCFITYILHLWKFPRQNSTCLALLINTFYYIYRCAVWPTLCNQSDIINSLHTKFFWNTSVFIIYLNDLPCGLHRGPKPVIYADDTGLLLTAENDEELKIKFTCTLDYMIEWFSANGLALKMEKTNKMKFTLSYQQNEAFQIIHIHTHTQIIQVLSSKLHTNKDNTCITFFIKKDNMSIIFI